MKFNRLELLKLDDGDAFNLRVVLSQWLAYNQNNPNAPQVRATLAKVEACFITAENEERTA